MSHVAATAKTSPTASRARGSRRTSRHVASMTNAMPVVCSTVAVPAFVYPMTTVYVTWHRYSPTPPNTASRTTVLVVAQHGRELRARLRTSQHEQEQDARAEHAHRREQRRRHAVPRKQELRARAREAPERGAAERARDAAAVAAPERQGAASQVLRHVNSSRKRAMGPSRLSSSSSLK